MIIEVEKIEKPEIEGGKERETKTEVRDKVELGIGSYGEVESEEETPHTNKMGKIRLG